MFADQAVIRVAAAAAANLTLHKTPRPPQTPNQDSRSPETPDAKSGQNQPCAIETGKAAGNPSATD
jgi:hypothetical protein